MKLFGEVTVHLPGSLILLIAVPLPPSTPSLPQDLTTLGENFWPCSRRKGQGGMRHWYPLPLWLKACRRCCLFLMARMEYRADRLSLPSPLLVTVFPLFLSSFLKDASYFAASPPSLLAGAQFPFRFALPMGSLSSQDNGRCCCRLRRCFTLSAAGALPLLKRCFFIIFISSTLFDNDPADQYPSPLYVHALNMGRGPTGEKGMRGRLRRSGRWPTSSGWWWRTDKG